ncbi:MAG: A/G-specific adenine glycosylase [Chromatiales bacterium]|nr:A/G-specific adenine glycosylase [Chromatiales bacterium]
MSGLLLRWWDEHGRRDLPWQNSPTPYRVWVSEIMLQQTQVATAEPYFNRFMQSFPDVMTLAAASEDDVLHHWSGLGYYSRARNLYKAAQTIAGEHAGNFPDELDELIALPGIGRSTAGAILSLACGQRQPVLDGNAKRVLARVFAVEGWPGSTANLKQLWELAEQCTPKRRVDNYTQAIMDLGATLCKRSRPLCSQCPLASYCDAFKQNRVAEIPAPKPRKTRPRRVTTLVMAVNAAGELLLEKRPPSGIWGGLWSFPELESSDVIADWCTQIFGAPPAEQRTWPEVSHSFSHFDLDMTPVEVEVASPPGRVMEADGWLWYNTRSPASVGLAAPVAKMLDAFGEQRQTRSGD